MTWPMYVRRGASRWIMPYVKSKNLQGRQLDGRSETLARVNPWVFAPQLPYTMRQGLGEASVVYLKNYAERILVSWIKTHYVDDLLPCFFYFMLQEGGSHLVREGKTWPPENKRRSNGARPLACIYVSRSLTGELRIRYETPRDMRERGLL